METRLRRLAGLRAVAHNPRAGSLLVDYDPARPAGPFLSAAATLLPQPPAPALPRPADPAAARRRKARLRRFHLVSLGGSFALCLGLGLAGTEGPHKAAGLLFAGLAGWHLLARSRRIFV